MSDLRWAAPSRADDPAWADLLGAMEEADERGETYTAEDLADEWESVWSHPATDARLVWDGAELVAFVWLKAISGKRAHHRVAIWGGVRPSHRRRGLGSALLEWSIQRGSEMAAAFDPKLPTKLDIDAADHQHDLSAIAARAGFEPVRTFLEVARPTHERVVDAPPPAGLELVSWTPELDDAARVAQAEAFADHWGSEPRSTEEWAQWHTGHRSFRPDLSVLAVATATGEVASLVLVAAYPQDWERVPKEAWISTVGTRRAWRGKGVARWLMTDVHRRVAASEVGFERVILGVDAENPTGALSLYRSLGYEEIRSVTSLARPPRA